MLIVNIFLIGCTEPYPIASEDFEELLVVDASLSDSLQYQTVKLSNSIPLNTESTTYINNAEVWIENSNGDIFNFHQIQTDSIYQSNVTFKAEQNTSYTLHIKTEDGEEYTSTEESTPDPIKIENVFAQAETNDAGAEGIQVYADVTSLGNNNLLNRFEYEETYKIKTPYRIDSIISVKDFYFYPLNDGAVHCLDYNYSIELTPVTEETSICYDTNYSNNLILASSQNNDSNNVFNVKIHFIENDNYIISEGYSILVKAYNENYKAYQFYQTTKNMNSENETLSTTQPGFFTGNLVNVNNPNQKIIGFFNVTTTAKKRIFFDYADFGFNQPSYFSDCLITYFLLPPAPTITLDYEIECSPEGPSPKDRLYQFITQHNFQLKERNGTIYTLWRPECSNCTTFASNIKPDFWED
ncbi:hypothetical protein Y10_33260 [Neptunitalea sp. Y10]|uniref:DUF4249 domain-containing protein n=2 Tax=Neptunitalea lumnitzerae TaxID=2965509 RepID=A0ABQ5MNM4_9FLAO|nr:hypothetical protein Y10_33260 [Neptunitalea sp. Y10]